MSNVPHTQKQTESLEYRHIHFEMPTGPVSFNELRTNGFLFYAGIPGDTKVHIHKGVYLRSGQMAEVGENVAFQIEANQVTKLKPPPPPPLITTIDHNFNADTCL